LWGIFTFQIVQGAVDDSERTNDLMKEVRRTAPASPDFLEIELASLALDNAAGFYSGDFARQFRSIAGIRERYDIATHAPLIPSYGLDIFATAQLFEPHARAIVGELDRVEPLIAEADAHQDLLSIPLMRPYAAVWGGIPFFYLGQHDRALKRIGDGARMSEEQSGVFWHLGGLVWHAVVDLDRGATPERVEALRTVLGHMRTLGVGIGIPYWSARLALGEAALGNVEEALTLAASAEEVTLASGAGCWRAEIQRARGRILAASGDLAAATAALTRAADTARTQNARLWLLRALTDLAALAPTDARLAERAALADTLPDAYLEAPLSQPQTTA
ncbi:MAG: hypothetical protein AAFQ51_02470, partial [Pseudomonadota bacterium]